MKYQNAARDLPDALSSLTAYSPGNRLMDRRKTASGEKKMRNAREEPAPGKLHAGICAGG